MNYVNKLDELYHYIENFKKEFAALEDLDVDSIRIHIGEHSMEVTANPVKGDEPVVYRC